MSALRLVINALGFQAAWLCAVGGAAADRVWLGPAAALALVGWHAFTAARPARELAGVWSVAALGTAWDSVAAAAGLIEYRGGAIVASAAPYWIAALWLAFATTLNVSLDWLRGRHALGALLGAVAGPFCYLAADTLGALRLVAMPGALLAQAAAWAVLLPLTVALAARFDGVAAARPHAAVPSRV
jgi:hypothetical protein